MTHDEMIAVIQAHKEGKQIEWKSNITGQWLPLNALDISFSIKEFEYRIKPTYPKEIWAELLSDGSLLMSSDLLTFSGNKISEGKILKYVLAE